MRRLTVLAFSATATAAVGMAPDAFAALVEADVPRRASLVRCSGARLA